MKPAYFNKVIIIQSLEKGFTGNRLQDDLSISAIFSNGVVSTKLIDIKDKQQFFSCLSNIRQDILDGKYAPIIHIEAHGNSDMTGLVLATNESVTWKEMKQPLSEINKATRFNLIVCVSACYGGSLVSQLVPNDRSPCWGLVGPKIEMYPDDLLKGFTGFYEELFRTQSGGKALKRLNEGREGEEANYFFTTAEKMFEFVWIGYLQKHSSNNELNKRANELVKNMRKHGIKPVPSRNEVKNSILQKHPEFFIESKELFFMMDLFDENRYRFKFEFETIKQKAESEQYLI